MFYKQNIKTHTHTHTYIYIYMCVCVCIYGKLKYKIWKHTQPWNFRLIIWLYSSTDFPSNTNNSRTLLHLLPELVLIYYLLNSYCSFHLFPTQKYHWLLKSVAMVNTDLLLLYNQYHGCWCLGNAKWSWFTWIIPISTTWIKHYGERGQWLILHSNPVQKFRTKICKFLFWMEHCGILNRCIESISADASPTDHWILPLS